MLIEFNVKNHLSFKGLNTLSLVKVKSFKEHEASHVIKVNDDLSLLKTIVLYGNNASGKSNLFASLHVFKRFVLNSFKDSLSESRSTFPIVKFLLNKKSESEPSYFEVSFCFEQRKYRYGFEVNDNQVTGEWLFHTTSKEVPLFTRQFQKIIINKSSFPEGSGLEGKTNSNVLFLTLVAQLNGDISNKVISWIKTINVVTSMYDAGYMNYTIEKLKTDQNFKSWAKDFIKYLEISDISTKETATSVELLPGGKIRQSGSLVTWHRRYDENNLFIDTIPFTFNKQESEGTKKLIYLLGPWYDTLMYGKLLIVDELDSRLHPNLILKLIEYFHLVNQKKAQLIFAVHDTSLLNKEVLRRDQIWFVEKDQFGSSDIYSLADFKTSKVRNKSAFDKNYIQGKYGAIPYFGGEEKLKEIFQEDE